MPFYGFTLGNFSSKLRFFRLKVSIFDTFWNLKFKNYIEFQHKIQIRWFAKFCQNSFFGLSESIPSETRPSVEMPSKLMPSEANTCGIEYLQNWIPAELNAFQREYLQNRIPEKLNTFRHEYLQNWISSELKTFKHLNTWFTLLQKQATFWVPTFIFA